MLRRFAVASCRNQKSPINFRDHYSRGATTSEADLQRNCCIFGAFPSQGIEFPPAADRHASDGHSYFIVQMPWTRNRKSQNASDRFG